MSKVKYLRNGHIITQTQSEISVLPTLESKVYQVGQDAQGGLFLSEVMQQFKLPDKIYGNLDTRSSRVLKTYYARPGKSTGVLLAGDKGSGKTLLAKKICNDSNLPTILVSAPFGGGSFNEFIKKIEQPCIIFIDEFEKVYQDDRGQQASILSLLDGTLSGHKLFLLTVNEARKVNGYMHNRPGRIFYKFTYDGLEEDFIQDFAQDHLKDKSQISALCTLGTQMDEFNFDILQSLVEEMNRYNESLSEVLKWLNVRAEAVCGVFRVTAWRLKDKTPLEVAKSSEYLNPFSDSISVQNPEDPWVTSRDVERMLVGELDATTRRPRWTTVTLSGETVKNRVGKSYEYADPDLGVGWKISPTVTNRRLSLLDFLA